MGHTTDIDCEAVQGRRKELSDARALIANEDHRHFVHILSAQNLLVSGRDMEDSRAFEARQRRCACASSQCRDFLKAAFGRDGVNEQKALAVANPLVLHGAEFLLAGGVHQNELKRGEGKVL